MKYIKKYVSYHYGHIIYICYIGLVPFYQQVLADQPVKLDRYYHSFDVTFQQIHSFEPVPRLAEQLLTLLAEQ